MRSSILTGDFDTCYLCGGRRECVHHIFEGYGRRIAVSERHGFIVPLCHRCHNMSNWSVHENKQLDLKLKQVAQERYERLGHSREEFIKLVGRNYL